MSNANNPMVRRDTLSAEDAMLLDSMHADFEVKKAHIGTHHGVVASANDGWRTRANQRRKVVTRKQVDSLPIPSIN